MSFLKRLVFYIGLLLGLSMAVLVGAVALTYLFTGKFANVQMGAGGKLAVTLMTPDEIVAMIRQQIQQAQSEGGEDDE